MSVKKHRDEDWFDKSLDKKQNFENFSDENIIELYKLQEIYRKRFGKSELENEEAIKNKLEKIREIEEEILLERIKQVIIPQILTLTGNILNGFYLQSTKIIEDAKNYITPFFKKIGTNCIITDANATLSAYPYYPGKPQGEYGHKIKINLFYPSNADLIISEKEVALINSKFYPYINLAHYTRLHLGVEYIVGIRIIVNLIMIRRFLDIKSPQKRISRKKSK